MIRLQNVSKYYYSDTSVTLALNKINIDLPDKGFVVITGESGSGKSTLLNLISGIDTFDNGEMYFKGEPTFQYDSKDWENYRRNEIGFVFQNYGLIGHYTALDNVVSALLILGFNLEEAREKARNYLNKVGLDSHANQKATELSSGQKQRLSIARALAKNTDIIVADEPTGNLDSETSAQIIDILKELSKEKLIIMVTHNYEQVEDKATFKIRLHDGEVVSKDYVNEGIEEASKEIEEAKELEKPDHIKYVKSEEENVGISIIEKRKNLFHTALRFIKMDFKGQKNRTMMFFMFFLFTGLISYIFLGELFANADDRITKKFDKTAFQNTSDKRLLLKRADDKEITDKDLKKINKVTYVKDVDKYDYCNDVSYYSEKNKDYKIVYGDKDENDKKTYEYKFYNHGKYVRSQTCISEDDLKAGKLPKKRNEIALYSTDKSKIGKKVEIFFKNDNIWEDGSYYHTEFTVTALLKKKTDQIYFSDDFATMISACQNDISINIEYAYDFRNDRYNMFSVFYPVIGEFIPYHSEKQSMKEMEVIYQEKEPENVKNLKRRMGEFRISKNHKSDERTQTNQDSPNSTNISAVIFGQCRMNIINSKGYDDGKVKKVSVLVKHVQGYAETPEDNFSDQSGNIVEISEGQFNNIFPDRMTSYQASVFITNYSKTDKVIKKLNKLGYVAISTYRVSTTEYDMNKVNERLVTIIISLIVLIVLIILQILIMRSFMKIRINEFFVFKFMGMRMRLIRMIVNLTNAIYALSTSLIILVFAGVLMILRVPFIKDIAEYYSFLNIIIYLIFNQLMAYLSSIMFNKLLVKKDR
ncbi:MAG: ABC transporter ATP-binding protein [Lachnospiraceae bacterium]|nr:ABC transporter ATP-binding protein [Lachnospiraceae bacterium]